MSRVRAVRQSIGAGVPARDLPFVDAAAVLVALFLAYGARAAFSSEYSFEWSAIAPFVRGALPVAVCALLLSTAALGLYGDRAAGAGAREHVAATAYAVAATVAIGIFWGGAVPPTAPLVLAAAVCLIACQHFGRRLYWHLAG
jgi:hypothetical protein